MVTLEKAVGLKSTEEIRKIIRSSLWSYSWPLFFGVLFLLLPFFFLYPLFKIGGGGIIIFVVLIITSLVIFLRTYLKFHFNAFILTNQRLIDLEQSGFFRHYVTGFLYDRIKEVNCQALGIRNAMLGIGDVYISLMGEKKIKLKLGSVKDPQKVVSDILFQQDEFLSQSREKALNQAEYLLNRIRRKVGQKVFEELISD